MSSPQMKYEWPVLTRCCFCLPLRRGLIAIGYVKFIYSAFMLGMYSYGVHIGVGSTTLFLHGAMDDIAAELCLILYIFELIACAFMLYGAHMKIPLYLRGCFYYGLASLMALLCAKVVEFHTTNNELFQVELLGFCFAGVFIQVYLLTVMWNLVKKLEADGCRQFENPLQHFVLARA